MNVIYPGQKIAVPCHKERTWPRIYGPHDNHDEANGDDNGKVESPEKPSAKPIKQPKTLKYPSGLELTIVNNPVLIGPNGYFRNPVNGEIPLVAIPRVKLFERVSKHFTLAEFVTIEEKEEGNCAVGETLKNVYSANGDFYFTHARLDPKLVELVEKIRTKYGKPVSIEEGYRPITYNNT